MMPNVLIDSKFLSSGVMCHVGSIQQDLAKYSNFCQINSTDRKRESTEDRKLSICEKAFAISGFGKMVTLLQNLAICATKTGFFGKKTPQIGI